MQTKARDPDTALRDSELDEELVGILTAISIVSKRLAKKLQTLQRATDHTAEGGDKDV